MQIERAQCISYIGFPFPLKLLCKSRISEGEEEEKSNFQFLADRDRALLSYRPRPKGVMK